MGSKVRNIIAVMLVGVMTITGMIFPGKQTVEAADGDQTVVTSQNTWKYLDNNTDPAVGTMLYGYNIRNQWTYPLDYSISYDDSSWTEGNAPFGFKVGEEEYLDVNTTLIANTDGTSDDSGTRTPAYFFRTSFEVDHPEDFKSIYYKLQFNDAVVIYLNGVEIGSHNIPASGYSSNLDYGAVTASDPFTEVENTVTTSMKDMTLGDMLHKGTNILSVELHQVSSTSLDAYMNFIEFTLSTEEMEREYVDLKALSVAPGSDESELRFSWFTSDSEAGQVKLYEGETEIGTFEGTSEAIEDGLYANKVTIDGLTENTTYFYRVGNGDTRSDKYIVTTGDASSFSFFLVGDPQIGTTNLTSDTTGWRNTVQSALEYFSNISFMVSAGDQVNTATNEYEYDGYLSPIGLTGLPTAQTVGNHDVSVNYLNHFNLANLDNTLGNTKAGGDYWYTYGSTLFMTLNSNNRSTAEHEQFMKQAIAANPEAKWKVVVFHHSIYSVASHAFDADVLERRENWVPVFDELGIDIVFMGHDHSYARTYQMYNDAPVEDVTMQNGAAVDPEGTVYITANSASGSKFYGLLQQEYYYTANLSQLNTPTISKIDMTDDSFTIKTYRIDTMEITDEYAIVKTQAVVQEPVNIGELDKLIKEAKAIDLTKYKDGQAKETFKTVLTNANATLINEKATQAEVDSIYAVLTQAMSALEMIQVVTDIPANTEELAKLVKDANAIDLTKYKDGEAKEAFKKALSEANVILANSIATQTEVDSSYAALLQAMSTLEKYKITVNGTTVNTNNSSTKSTNNTAAKKAGPKTGDSNVIAIWVIPMVMCLGVSGVVVVSKKKKHHNE